jgi:phospholipid/cholesterol/gamma-HCH transport system substrate-binding protein
VRAAPAIALLVAATVAVAVIVAGRGSDGHRVFVTVREATDVISGQDVRSAGENVGSIASVEPVDRGRAVRLTLELGDRAWPLPQGTRFALRWGGTISYSNRFVALTRPAHPRAMLRDGATIPAADFATPVEVDQLVGTFTRPVRRGVKAFLRRGGVTFATARPQLRRALDAAPPAVRQADLVLRDLDSDQRSLDALVRSSARVTAAVRSADPGLGALVSGAATTFDAAAGQAVALKATLSRSPQTFAAARSTLARAGHTLTAAAQLTDRLAPGVVALRRIAHPLDDVLSTVVDVGPDVRTTLAVAGRSTSDLDPLLAKATALSPQIGSVAHRSVTQLRCIRPYTPDIISFFTNWGDFLSATDGKDKYLRASVESFMPGGHNAQTGDSAQAARQYPGLRYAFPRPPGYNAGQPWFLPECGAGRDALDPSKDPEARG